MKNSQSLTSKNSGSPQQNVGILTTSQPPQKNISKVQNQGQPTQIQTSSGQQNLNTKNYPPQPQSNYSNLQGQVPSKNIGTNQSQNYPYNSPPSKNVNVAQNQAPSNKNIVGQQLSGLPNKNQNNSVLNQNKLSSNENPRSNFQGTASFNSPNISNQKEESKLSGSKQNYSQYLPISQNQNIQNLNSNNDFTNQYQQNLGSNIDNIKKYETYLNEACTPGMFPYPLHDNSKYLRSQNVYGIHNPIPTLDKYVSRNEATNSYPYYSRQGLYNNRYEEYISRYNTNNDRIIRDTGMLKKNDEIVDTNSSSFKYESPFARSFSLPRNNFLDLNESLNYLNNYSKKYIRNPDSYYDYPRTNENSRFNTLSPNSYHLSSRMRNFGELPYNRYSMFSYLGSGIYQILGVEMHLTMN